MTESELLSAAERSVSESAPVVSVAVTLAGHGLELIHVCEMPPAHVAAYVDSWWRNGGWRSIRIEHGPSATGPGVFEPF